MGSTRLSSWRTAGDAMPGANFSTVRSLIRRRPRCQPTVTWGNSPEKPPVADRRPVVPDPAVRCPTLHTTARDRLRMRSTTWASRPGTPLAGHCHRTACSSVRARTARIEDLRAAAAVMESASQVGGARRMVVPGSGSVKADGRERKAWIAGFHRNAGARVARVPDARCASPTMASISRARRASACACDIESQLSRGGRDRGSRTHLMSPEFGRRGGGDRAISTDVAGICVRRQRGPLLERARR